MARPPLDPEAEPKPDAAPRIEIRDGVRVTIYPPMLAVGALVFRSALGRGGVALASGGQQRMARRGA